MKGDWSSWDEIKNKFVPVMMTVTWRVSVHQEQQRSRQSRRVASSVGSPYQWLEYHWSLWYCVLTVEVDSSCVGESLKQFIKRQAAKVKYTRAGLFSGAIFIPDLRPLLKTRVSVLKHGTVCSCSCVLHYYLELKAFRLIECAKCCGCEWRPLKFCETWGIFCKRLCAC